jgi:hypothetical protein
MTKNDPDAKKRAKIQFEPEDGAEMWSLVNTILPARDKEDQVAAANLQRDYPAFKIQQASRWTTGRLVIDLLRKEARRLRLDPDDLSDDPSEET